MKLTNQRMAKFSEGFATLHKSLDFQFCQELLLVFFEKKIAIICSGWLTFFQAVTV